MNGLFIIQLVGVAGLFIGLGFFISIVLKMHKTLSEMDITLKSLGQEIWELMPRISSALLEIEKTGEDISRTANASTALLNRVNGTVGTSPMLDSAVRFLPAIVSLIRFTTPLLSRKKNK
ncbi:MAG: hypothetical protein KAQ97_04930 [Candidatus Fermentibacteraceae bacterium]|nr:hypothetical protein [Candidatus Fermentibacteraceae bacterium]